MKDNMPNEPYGIALLVEAPTSHLAREKAVETLTEKRQLTWGRAWSDFSLMFVEPVRASSQEGQAILREHWIRYMKRCVEDVGIVMDQLEPYWREGKVEAPTEVLNQMEFRTSCYRLGLFDGWPITIYDPTGLGVTFAGNLQEIIQQDEQGRLLWVISAQVSD